MHSVMLQLEHTLQMQMSPDLHSNVCIFLCSFLLGFSKQLWPLLITWEGQLRELYTQNWILEGWLET